MKFRVVSHHLYRRKARERLFLLKHAQAVSLSGSKEGVAKVGPSAVTAAVDLLGEYGITATSVLRIPPKRWQGHWVVEAA